MNLISKDLFFEVLEYGKVKQNILFPIFKNLHDVAKKNNICFSLAEGTLLGCIRHGGFIPWDDDIDVYMTKESLLELKKHIDSSQVKIIKYLPNLYFYDSKIFKHKIDIFIPNFKDHIYGNISEYIEKEFEGITVLVPKNYEQILSYLYEDWKDIYCVNNHKIAREKFNSLVGYKASHKTKYYHITPELMNKWIKEYYVTRDQTTL